ncbi:cysteine--tRNA ligase 2, cytoplasmic-like isoform X1 [Silene latifolia]|uniref:cysteine--tRNA ligase 2, cytoplasmic-like isoform X1 n=1 Tax=Silene latifolia TaxID=37657 RepID=UPI003D77916A
MHSHLVGQIKQFPPINLAKSLTARNWGLSGATMAEENVNSNSNSNSNTKPPPLELKLYNTMTKEKEVFKPKVPNKVGMYVCGVTAYDMSHIGHARAYVSFDVLFRFLKYLRYEVTYVRNFTDVDDKIINAANEIKAKDPDNPLSEPLKLSDYYCREFLKDMDDLQCLTPTHQPRVSDHIDDIIEMIKKLIGNGCAYSLDDGDVYFSVDNFERYGLLSNRKLEDNRPGERVSVDHRKRNYADFALWKSAKPGEIFWPSPWGNGRPGWHIECSAMSEKYLTSSFDIHGGGIDLIFPHHENELAQSCAACEEAKIGYWVHNGFVNINGEKMSKSTKNYFTIREVTEQYHPLALRYFLLSMNYNSPVNFSLPQMDLASDAVFRLYQTLQDCSDAIRSLQESGIEASLKKTKSESESEKLKKDFDKRMHDDLHAADVLKGSLEKALRFINSELNGLKKHKEKKLLALQSLLDLEATIKTVLDVLGLASAAPYSEVLQQLKGKALIRAKMTEDEISGKIEERVMARKNKDFTKSDKIRKELIAKGISLMDLPTGTVWRPCVPEEEV